MKKLFLLIFLFGLNVCAQNRDVLAGQVFLGTYQAQANDVRILNKTQNLDTQTLDGGFFSIAAKRGDTLVFTGVGLPEQSIVLARKHFRNDVFVFRLTVDGTQLSEVRVNTATPLTKLNEGKKVYTPAERKLRTSQNASGQRTPENAGIAAVGTDPVINAISGQTAERKKELEVERKRALQEQMTDAFGREYFSKTLQIPANRVDGFLFYAVEQPDSESKLRASSPEEVALELSRLASEYLKLENAPRK